MIKTNEKVCLELTESPLRDMMSGVEMLAGRILPGGVLLPPWVPEVEGMGSTDLDLFSAPDP